MAFGFKKSSVKPASTPSGSKGSANPQPVVVSSTKPSPKAPTIDVHPSQAMKPASPAQANRAPVFPTAAVPVAIAPEQIRVRAYEIYKSRGEKPGDPVTDWCQAERELRAERRPVDGPRV